MRKTINGTSNTYKQRKTHFELMEKKVDEWKRHEQLDKKAHTYTHTYIHTQI